MSSEERDINDVRQQEGRRGKRPKDVDLRRERKAAIRRYLELATEEEFVAAMRDDVGLNPEELWLALQAWREYRAS
jgi:hypothetical protein